MTQVTGWIGIIKLRHILLSNYLVEVATLVSEDAEDDVDGHVAAQRFEAGVVEPEAGGAERGDAVEDRRPERMVKPRSAKGDEERRPAGGFHQNREQDHAADEFGDAEFLRHAENHLADLLAALRKLAPARQPHDRAERHVADAADLDQDQDDQLAEQAEPLAGADGRQAGGGKGRGGSELGVQRGDRAVAEADRQGQQHPAGQNVGQVTQRHQAHRVQVVHETAEPLPFFFHVPLLFPSKTRKLDCMRGNATPTICGVNTLSASC